MPPLPGDDHSLEPLVRAGAHRLPQTTFEGETFRQRCRRGPDPIGVSAGLRLSHRLLHQLHLGTIQGCDARHIGAAQNSLAGPATDCNVARMR